MAQGEGNGVNYAQKFATEQYFKTSDDVWNWALAIAHENGFNIVRATNGRRDKSTPFLACYYRCDRYGDNKCKKDGESSKKSCTKKCGCTFRIRAVQDVRFVDGQAVVVWVIRTFENFGTHNHELIAYTDGHCRQSAFDESDLTFIKQNYEASVSPKEIEAGLFQRTPAKPRAKMRAIYYRTGLVRAEMRAGMNPAQHMLALASSHGYVKWHDCHPETREVRNVFMSHPESVKLYRAYPHVNLIDSTYKTNNYNMTLVQIVGVTPVGCSFLIAYALIESESESGYTWMLERLKLLLTPVGKSPDVFITDREFGLINSIPVVFPGKAHLLCVWHVNCAVENKALQQLKNSGLVNRAMHGECGWSHVVDATNLESYEMAWSAFKNKWTKLAAYVARTWGPYHDKFVKCHTNKVRHLGNTATSRVESAHALLKSWLKSSKIAIDTMWSRAHLMIEAQHTKIRSTLENSRSTRRFTKPDGLFNLLPGNVSKKAIDLMEAEYLRGESLGERLREECGCVIWSTHGLPCACRLHRMHSEDRMVHVENVPEFWRTLVYESESQTPRNDNDVLDRLFDEARSFDPCLKREFIERVRVDLHPEETDIVEPAVRVNTKGRPRNSTTRNLSAVEHSRRKYAKQDTRQPNNSGPRFGNFPPGPDGAPLEINYTIGPISSSPLRVYVAAELSQFFDGWVDVRGDGHCGYRVMSHGARGVEDHYLEVRAMLVIELSRPIYLELYGNFRNGPDNRTGYERALHRITSSRRGAVGREHWLGDEDFYGLASLFNWTICMISSCVDPHSGVRYWTTSATFPPLRTSDPSKDPGGVLWVLHATDHWVRLHAVNDAPMPPIAPLWGGVRDDNVRRYEQLYAARIQLWHDTFGTSPRQPRQRTTNPDVRRRISFDVDVDLLSSDSD